MFKGICSEKFIRVPTLLRVEKIFCDFCHTKESAAVFYG